jgi:diacylglycerol O-acyltransferase
MRVTNGGSGRPRARPVIERASASDRAFWAMDTGAGAAVPEQIGVILSLDPGSGLDPERARLLLAERIPSVPRLRQRLVRAPLGGGGPIWVDDPGFEIGNHVRTVQCREPADERTLLDTALSVVMSPLSHARPLWAIAMVTAQDGTVAALVVVVHHALADGIGGLAVLTELIDAPARERLDGFPRPAPGRAALTRQAWTSRLVTLGHPGQSWHLLRASMRASGGLRPARAAASSLNQRTGADRRLAVLHVDLDVVRTAAHRHRATVNDAVLVAVAGALRRILQARGESVDTFVVAVPVSGRRPDDGGTGNMVSPLLVSVPATGSVAERLQHVAAQVREHKADATGPPPIAVLGWLFRPMAALGGFRFYMNRQRRFHTLVTHVRGPVEKVSFGRAAIAGVVPVGVGPGGNITVFFSVLSYAGTLTLTAIADPGHLGDLDALIGALRAELDLIARSPGSTPATDETV